MPLEDLERDYTANAASIEGKYLLLAAVAQAIFKCHVSLPRISSLYDIDLCEWRSVWPRSRR